MIPFLTSTYLRLGLAVGLVAAVAFAGWRVSTWKQSHEALPEVRQQLADEQACSDGSECQKRVASLEARQAAISQTVVSNYEAELEALRARPVRTRTVRLCQPADPGDVRIPAASGGTGSGTAPAGLVPGGTGPDIGGGLYALADRADELSAQCRAIIRRDRALASD